MFSGIVNGTAEIVFIEKKGLFQRHILKFSKDLLFGLVQGASIAQNGCCLTVVSIEKDFVSVDLIEETLRITNLGNLKIGNIVNIERAIKIGDEIGGHQIFGHICTIAKISKMIYLDKSCRVWFKVQNIEEMKYILYKGFIAVDGVSLTISGLRNKNEFSVHLIPQTLEKTTFGKKKLNDTVNIEFDFYTASIIKTVERIFSNNL